MYIFSKHLQHHSEDHLLREQPKKMVETLKGTFTQTVTFVQCQINEGVQSQRPYHRVIPLHNSLARLYWGA